MKRLPEKKRFLRGCGAVVLIVVLLLGLTLLLRRCPEEPGPEPKKLHGIDVSAHQGQIQWETVADSGVQFVMVRLGYRGYESGLLHVDPYARQNLEGARAAGLQVGAYFFSQATNRQEALEEAELALEILDGFALDLPLVYDWEYVSQEARTGAMDGVTLLQCVDAFCDAVSEAYPPMIYFNQELSRTLLDLEQVAEYPFWLAKYTGDLDVDYPVQMWQYSDNGRIDGIEGPVDLDWYFYG